MTGWREVTARHDIDVICNQCVTKERPLEALQHIRAMRLWCDDRELELVRIAREEVTPTVAEDIAAIMSGRGLFDRRPRFSWAAIGRALGSSQSAAHRRFGDRVGRVDAAS